VEIVADLQSLTVTLAGAEDTGKFAVRVAGPPDASGQRDADVHRLGDVLAAAGVGRLGPGDHAFIRPDAVRFNAAGQVGEGWEERFAAMVDDADSRGWTADDGWIRAHVEWPGTG
jgi:hypothetical protein